MLVWPPPAGLPARRVVSRFAAPSPLIAGPCMHPPRVRCSDRDRAVMVLLHNVAKIVVRSHAPLPHLEGSASARPGHNEVVLFGVDGVPIPGFHFYSGGAPEFLEALSSEVALQHLGSRTATRGAERWSTDQTFLVVSSTISGQGAFEATQRELPTAAANPAPRPTAVPSGPFAGLMRVFRRKAPVEPLEERCARFQVRRAARQLQRAFVGWRLGAHRLARRKRNVRTLLAADIAVSAKRCWNRTPLGCPRSSCNRRQRRPINGLTQRGLSATPTNTHPARRSDRAVCALPISRSTTPPWLLGLPVRSSSRG